MIFKNLFKKKPKLRICKKCGAETEYKYLSQNAFICPQCGAYMRMRAAERLALITDENTFSELYADLQCKNPIDFPGYDEKIAKAKEESGLHDAVVCGTCEIGGEKAAVFVMDSSFMMGSMGTVVGEKITSLFEYATENSLPVVGFTTSGGARMQEGILSLMQMAKISGAARRHSDKKNLYIAVLTDPTTGGVTASFAMQGDIIIAEPKALIGFAGKRVIEQTTGEKLPEGFQTAEFMLSHGFIDIITERKDLKETITTLLKVHANKGGAL